MRADPNMGDLVQREHPQNWGGIGVGSEAQKTCNISETVQERAKVKYYYDGLIGSRIRAFNWHQNPRP